MKLNKKGYINDIVTMTGVLLGLFIVLSLCIFILVQYNDAFQNSSVVTSEAKALQQDYTDTYPGMMAWFFPITFIALVVYTLITAYLVEVISKVWFVVGFIVVCIQAIVSYVVGQVYDNLTELSVFNTGASFIPGATWYFGNVILANAIIGFLILLALYFKRDA